jgi:NADH dehydrogenase [ubiquinone] 1 alpha subcomplex assembly factor 7
LNPLGQRLAERIARSGPITVADYMAAALADTEHGYYRRADPLGAGGDFTTAPEISQLFGELIGAWLIDCWDQAGRPEHVNLVELGPGRGTLMADMLRVARRAPDWLKAITVHLVEINPRLRQAQAASLAAYAPYWHEAFATVPDGPVMLVANEFLDALPVRQLVFRNDAWRERLVDWTGETGFHFRLVG